MDTSRPTTTVYYGVYTPGDNRDINGSEVVFEDKLEALKVARKNKKSRFKAFQFYHEAVEFALNGSEFPNNNISFNGPLDQRPDGGSVQIGEKASPFKGPKPQDLVELRKLIEAGEYAAVKQLLWQNPRYLVSSGDTPSILQEGARYNPLHVAAKSKHADIAELILSTVSDVEFIKLLYGDDNQQNAEERSAVLLDLYLNTPNKALNETPLHFASKHGAADVVEVLVSYPQCDKTLKNKFNKTADQMICERADCSDMAAVKRKIAVLLQDNYYVPVLRTEDRSMPPVIGEPFSPTKPPVYNKDPLSPRLEIHAYAGPMDKREAQRFRKIWKTPPRSTKAPSEAGEKDLESLSSLRFKDPDKGLERIGKRLANDCNLTWKEYWPFLGCFVDISSEEGLNLLECHLTNRYAILNSYIVEEIKRNSPEGSKLDVLSPISDLCVAFSSCRLNDNSNRSLDSVVYIDKACQVFANRIANDILSILSSEDGILQTLETEIKQLELLTTSYMEDGRFSTINFQKVHSRLGTLVGQKLYNNMMDDVRSFLFTNFCSKIEGLLESVTKSVDCFSSDDESHNYRDAAEQRKPTIYRKQLICLIHYVLTVLTQHQKTKYTEEEDVSKGWEVAEACPCIYHVRKFKKNYLSRNNSFKGLSFGDRSELDGVQKRLCFEDCDQSFVQNGIKLSRNTTEESSSEEDNDIDEEKFYTPPSSPELFECTETDSEDEFNDTELPKYDAFIEGDYPTKVDCDIFNALNYSEIKLDCKKYPNIYKWHHRISLFTAEERESWSNLKGGPKKMDTPNNSFSGDSSVMCSTPSKSWMRVTGANSPKAFRSEGVH